MYKCESCYIFKSIRIVKFIKRYNNYLYVIFIEKFKVLKSWSDSVAKKIRKIYISQEFSIGLLVTCLCAISHYNYNKSVTILNQWIRFNKYFLPHLKGFLFLNTFLRYHCMFASLMFSQDLHCYDMIKVSWMNGETSDLHSPAKLLPGQWLPIKYYCWRPVNQ